MQLAYAHGSCSPRFLVVPPPLTLRDVRVDVLPPCDVRVRVREALWQTAAAPAAVPITVVARIAGCFCCWYWAGGIACTVMWCMMCAG